ncbi:hypothetical protein BOX15_Mlig021884g1 [Macrostomum lignano]|uniref:Uncharacterized protein n=1 Tax=Macrostomum lignano TaxID=282301 RepID=A0A267GFU7_9PLAT|nr:hypothetical protein BOX15_Mlig021884g1 [Macrostomum lignano]
MIPKSVSFASRELLSSIWTGPLILKKVNRPDLENTRHKENSLKLWIFEAKRLPAKKRYFCEICLNHILYARTTSKEKTADSDPFWGEPFEFSNLQEISLVTVKLFREANRKKKKDQNQLIGEVHLPVHEILSQTEQWYSLQAGKTAANASPSLRIKSRYLSVDVLPVSWYDGLRDFLLADYCQLVRVLEPSLPVRLKEDLACKLVALAHSSGKSESLVADLLLQELEHCGASEAAAVVAFRGNSIATKSVEYYLRLVGSDYLRSVLAEPVTILLRSDECCEVDPMRVSGQAELESNQQSLRLFAELFWTRVFTSADRLPVEFGRLFAGIRQRSDRQLCDQLVGASIFLRFICPAILGPSLFGLCQELPGPRTARSLTLIAKTVQNLANGTWFGGKEAYMNFMNKFLEQHQQNMAHFVASLQTIRRRQPAAGGASADSVDAGFELAQAHTLLTSAVQLLRNNGHPAFSAAASGEVGADGQKRCLDRLSDHLDTVSQCLKLNVPPQPLTPSPPPLQPRSASLALTAAAAANGDSDSDTRPVRNTRPAPQVAADRQETAASTDRDSRPLSGASAVVGHSQIQEDWRRVLDEAAASAAATVASASAAVAAVSGVSSSAGSSSGYQSGRLRKPQQQQQQQQQKQQQKQTQPDPLNWSNDSRHSPLQFHNPSYQKPASALVLPAPAQQQQQQASVDSAAFRRDANNDEDEESSDSDPSSSEVVASSSAGTGTSSTRSSSESRNQKLQQEQQQPPPLPPHKVRMGLRSVQHPHHQPQQQQQQQLANSELLELQRELNETRRQLEATEARLRSNEREKLQMMDEFRRGAEERQRRELENSKQLAEIMERLRLLENEAKASGAVGRPV